MRQIQSQMEMQKKMEREKMVKKEKSGTLARMKVLGTVLKIGASIGIITLPWIKPLLWLFYNRLPNAIRANLGAFAPSSLPFSGQLVGVCISLPAAVIVAVMLYHIIRLFSLYSSGIFLSSDNALRIRNVGALLLANTLYSLLIEKPLTVVACTLANPPGRKSISFGIGSGDLIALFVAGFLLITAFVTLEAHRIREESDLTI